LAAQPISGVLHFDISFLCRFSVITGSSSVISGVFTAEEVDGVGDKGSGYTTMFDVQTLLETFLKMTLICLFH